MNIDPIAKSQPFVPLLRKARFTIETDLVMSDATSLQLKECLMRLRHHKTIYVDWNFASVDPVGRGAVLNLYGKPGTGKTMAAEAIAGTLGMPFIHLGIAELESRFMGETARNILAAFEVAERESALLFFDEAETLLGKRLGQVSQGVDNEVNAMRTTMFMELERFSGIAVFATNLARSYDEAFRSRVTYHVRFTLPDAKARLRLWDRMMVREIPLADTREALIQRCADLSDGFSGREIRTCMRLALPKALLDAGEDAAGARLAWSHLESAIQDLRRAQREIASEPPLGDTDVGAARALLGLASTRPASE